MTGDISYIVITGQVEGTPETGYDTYHYWDGRQFAEKPQAVSHGFETRGSDDFRIGVVQGTQLLSVWWMDKQIGEPPEELAAISAGILLAEGAR